MYYLFLIAIAWALLVIVLACVVLAIFKDRFVLWFYALALSLPMMLAATFGGLLPP